MPGPARRMPDAPIGGLDPSSPFAKAGGHYVIALTVAGKTVRGWMAGGWVATRRQEDGTANPFDTRLRYWCHGLSLGTYKEYGYTVLGNDVPIVLADEYTAVGDATAHPGDVVIFENGMREVTHSCLVLKATTGIGNPSAVMVRSKNGADIERSCRLSELKLGHYAGDKLSLWRPRHVGPGPGLVLGETKAPLP